MNFKQNWTTVASYSNTSIFRLYIRREPIGYISICYCFEGVSNRKTTFTLNLLISTLNLFYLFGHCIRCYRMILILTLKGIFVYKFTHLFNLNFEKFELSNRTCYTALIFVFSMKFYGEILSHLLDQYSFCPNILKSIRYRISCLIKIGDGKFNRTFAVFPIS